MNWKKKFVEVNAPKEYREIAEDFSNPLEVFREAISNSFDHDASKIFIKCTMEEIDGDDMLIIEIEDDGRGMNEEEISENFWDLGNSGKNKNKTPIGDKGHGTKTYMRSKFVTVYSGSNGNNWVAKCDNPLKSISNDELPEILWTNDDSIDRTDSYTIIRIAGLRASFSDFTQDYVKDYILWFTKYGSIENQFKKKPKNEIQLSLQCLDKNDYELITFGHPFPKENSDLNKLWNEKGVVEAPDWYVKKWIHTDVPLPGRPDIRIDVAFYIEGFKAKQDYNPMIVSRVMVDSKKYKLSDRYGIYLCKDYIPIQRVNDWVSGFGGGSNSVVLLHAFVNCQSFKLTANRGSVGNTDRDIIQGIKDYVDQLLEKIDTNLVDQGLYQLIEWREEAKTLNKEQSEFARRSKDTKSMESAVYKDARLIKPRNEAEVFGLLVTIMSMIPDHFNFYVMDYNTHIGIDMLVKNMKEMRPTTGEYSYLELKYLLTTYFNHSFSNLRYLVCWDLDDKLNVGTEIVGIEKNKTYELKQNTSDEGLHSYFLLSKGGDSIFIYTLKSITEKLGINFT